MIITQEQIAELKTQLRLLDDVCNDYDLAGYVECDIRWAVGHINEIIENVEQANTPRDGGGQ